MYSNGGYSGGLHGLQQRHIVRCTVPLPRLGMHKYVVMSLGLNFACRHSEHTIVIYMYVRV